VLAEPLQWGRSNNYQELAGNRSLEAIVAPLLAGRGAYLDERLFTLFGCAV
jgi:hypothetical protein